MNVRPIKRPMLEDEDENSVSRSSPTVAWYEKRLEKSPQDIGLRFGKARLHMKAEEWKEAKREMDIIASLDPDQVQAWTYLRIANKMLGNHEELLKCHKNLTRLKACNEETECEHGRTLLCLGRYEEAKQAFDDVLETNEACADAWVGRAEAIRMAEASGLPHDRSTQVPEAVGKEITEGYGRALEMEPHNMKALQGSAEWSLHKQCGGEALVLTENALHLKGNSCVSWEQKGRALEILGKKEKAQEAFTQAASHPLTPGENFEPFALSSKANALEKTGQGEASLRCLEKVIDIDRANQQALMKKAELLTGLGKFQEAADTYGRMTELRPRDHYLWYLKGDSEKGGRLHERALTSFDRSLALKSEYHPAMFSKGETLYEMGRLEEGGECIEALLKMDPTHDPGLRLRNVIHQTMNERRENDERNEENLPKARVAPKRKVIARSISGQTPPSQPRMSSHPPASSPTSLPPLVPTARGLLNAGRKEEALSLMNKRKAEGRNDWEAVALMGECLWKNGKGEEALAAYERSIDLEPRKPELYVSGARIHFENDDLYEALQMIRSCPVEDDPSILRAEIEIEAEMLAKNIKSKFGLFARPDEKQKSKKKKKGHRVRKRPAPFLKRLGTLNKKIEGVIRETPEDALLWYARALVLYEMGDLRQALISIEKALWRDPNNRRYWETKAELYLLYGKKDKAEECFKKARGCKTAPENMQESEDRAASEEGLLSPVEEEYYEHDPPERIEDWGEALLRHWEWEENNRETLGGEIDGTAGEEDRAPGDALWESELLAEWKEPMENAMFECPECNSPVMQNAAECEGCGAIFRWEIIGQGEDHFIDGLLFTDRIQDMVVKDGLSTIVLKLKEGICLAISSTKPHGKHVVEEWHPVV